ncbi:MAG: hypothetical protein JW769_00780 [Parachlamydiales bacterium]|nr:hypothetical protein [Parachlamydiales bacterium]
MHKILAIIFLSTFCSLHSEEPSSNDAPKIAEESVLHVEDNSMPRKKKTKKRRAQKRMDEETSHNTTPSNQTEKEKSVTE